MPPAERPLLRSWSGGKDSALALWRAVVRSGRPVALLTMMAEGGERSRSHGSKRSASVREAGEAVLRDSVWFLDLRPAAAVGAGTAAPSYTRPDA